MNTRLTAWSRGHGTETSSFEVPPDTHTRTHFEQIGQDASCLIACCSWYHIANGLRSFSNVSVMQDRLAQQQKAMAEERAYLKEIISRMDTQLNEQQRQLEKVGLKSGFKKQDSTNAYIRTPEIKTDAFSFFSVHLRSDGR